jgi:hypothetical protein
MVGLSFDLKGERPRAVHGGKWKTAAAMTPRRFPE